MRKDGAGFKEYAQAQSHTDKAGRAAAKIPIRKDGREKDVFRIAAKHCSGEWSNGEGTDREVSETAGPKFEHDHVSGIHFPKNSSFISPEYLATFKALEEKFGAWRKSHPETQLVVFGHAERDEEDPRPPSQVKMSGWIT